MSDLLKSGIKTAVAALVAFLATRGVDIGADAEAALIVLVTTVATLVLNALAERFPLVAKVWPAPVYIPKGE